jgi:hypothetical protein
LGFACDLVKLVWLTPKLGIALADDIPFLLRTVDGGSTWSPRQLPGDRGFFRLERYGTRLWVYGVHIARSDDLGETWKGSSRSDDRNHPRVTRDVLRVDGARLADLAERRSLGDLGRGRQLETDRQ